MDAWECSAFIYWKVASLTFSSAAVGLASNVSGAWANGALSVLQHTFVDLINLVKSLKNDFKNCLPDAELKKIKSDRYFKPMI